MVKIFNYKFLIKKKYLFLKIEQIFQLKSTNSLYLAEKSKKSNFGSDYKKILFSIGNSGIGLLLSFVLGAKITPFYKILIKTKNFMEF